MRQRTFDTLLEDFGDIDTGNKHILRGQFTNGCKRLSAWHEFKVLAANTPNRPARVLFERTSRAAAMGDAAALAALPIENLLAADHIGNTAAHLAAKFGHEGCLRVIAQLGVFDDALAAAAGTPELHTLQMRREWGLRALSAPNSNGLTPAHRAALNNHAGCLRLLAELKVNLSPGNLHGAHLSRGKHGRSEQLARTVRTPLSMAARCGHEPCVRVLGDTALLGQSAREGLVSVDRSGASPMHAAAQNGHVVCVQALFEMLSLRSKEQSLSLWPRTLAAS
jgi:ankyrin repeat protein